MSMPIKQIRETIEAAGAEFRDREDEVFASESMSEAAEALEALLSPYAAFTEANESEGETWTFFIPVAGNENSLDNLRFFLDRYTKEVGDDSPYSLSALGNEVPGYAVNVLMDLANDNGYMSRYYVLAGRLSTARLEAGLGSVTGDDFLNALYKGRVRGFFE